MSVNLPTVADFVGAFGVFACILAAAMLYGASVWLMETGRAFVATASAIGSVVAVFGAFAVHVAIFGWP